MDRVQGPGFRVDPNAASHKVNASYTYGPCQGAPSQNPQFRSFAAAYLTLRQRKWVIDELNEAKASIRAHVCLRGYPDACATLLFWADPHGRLEARNPPGKPVREDVLDDLQRWMKFFEQEFSHYRCYSEQALEQEMQVFRTTADQSGW